MDYKHMLDGDEDDFAMLDMDFWFRHDWNVLPRMESVEFKSITCICSIVSHKLPTFWATELPVIGMFPFETQRTIELNRNGHNWT